MCKLTAEDKAIIRTLLVRECRTIADSRRAVEISDKLDACVGSDPCAGVGATDEEAVQCAPMSGGPIVPLPGDEEEEV